MTDQNTSDLLTETTLPRRRALKILGFSGVAATGLVSLMGCEDKAKAADPAAAKPAEKKAAADAKPAAAGDAKPAADGDKAAGNCGEADIDKESKSLRTALQYKPVSEVEGKYCAGCVQYVAGQYGECGGCKLFKGGVQPKGHCLSYAPKES